jgi:hypothetical protein
MLLGYIRTWPSGPTFKKQKDALLRAGVEDSDRAILVDHVKSAGEVGRMHHEAVEWLRPGDELIVYCAAVLGPLDTALAALAKTVRSGAPIRDLDSGKLFTMHADASVVADFASVVSKSRGQWQTTAARAKVRPRKPKLTGKARAAAKVDWADPTQTQEQVAAKYGVSAMTLYRAFGRKGAHDFSPPSLSSDGT